MRKLIFLALFLISFYSFSQNGKLLIVGGGAEYSNENSWNAEAYLWAVTNAQNKRVAVISMEEDETLWLENYFVNSCGAVWSKEFLIDAYYFNNADLQETYDSLITYDMIFFKGGNQKYYYLDYKDTKTQEAVEYVYNNGGVICGTSAGMAILSDVIYTAEEGTVYPDECIENPNNQYITLKNDFLHFLPGFVFDTHFAERGRMARLISFIANWELNNNENIIGIGIDDLTAMAIDENFFGTVYGTGAANIFIAQNDNTFSISESKLLAENVKVIQLLQGNSLNLNSLEIGGESLSDFVEPLILEENGNYKIFASGSDLLIDNNSMIENFFNENSDNSNITIITGQSQTVAEQYKTKLQNLGATEIDILSAIDENGNSLDFYQQISSSSKILFVNNNWTDLKTFLSTQNGENLVNKLKSNDMITAFVGDNSRFAGKVVIENYLTTGAAYHAELEFDEGLGLLQTSVIMPNTYKETDIFENTICGVPYTLINNELKFGIWLTSKNFMKYYPENNQTFVASYGDAPAMIIEFDGCNTAFSQQTSQGTGSPRMIAGFEEMIVSLIDDTTPYKLGDNVHVNIENQNNLIDDINVFPVPTDKKLNVIWQNKQFNIQIVNIIGQIVFQKDNIVNHIEINTEKYNSGNYILNIQSIDGEIFTKNIIIIK